MAQRAFVWGRAVRVGVLDGRAGRRVGFHGKASDYVGERVVAELWPLTTIIVTFFFYVFFRADNVHAVCYRFLVAETAVVNTERHPPRVFLHLLAASHFYMHCFFGCWASSKYCHFLVDLRVGSSLFCVGASFMFLPRLL